MIYIEADSIEPIDLNKTVPNKDPNENIVKELRNIYKELHELNKNLRRIK